ncbi:MAG: hypothetical protein SOV46_02585 [Candidatus Faecousia sp.]|nr:hypothetical protein [Candidatus Faecousia sp.]
MPIDSDPILAKEATVTELTLLDGQLPDTSKIIVGLGTNICRHR